MAGYHESCPWVDVGPVGSLWRSSEDKAGGKLKSKDIDEVLNEYIRTHHPGEAEVVLTTFAETSAEVDTDLTATLNYHQLCRIRDSELDHLA